MTEVKCERCGTFAGYDVPDVCACTFCPAVACQECGDADDRWCSCWIDLRQMPLADVKALFARYEQGPGALSIDPVVTT